MNEFAADRARATLAGGAKWLDLAICGLALLAIRPGLAESALLMGALVVVPLGLRIVDERVGGGWRAQLRRIAALSLAASLLLPRGWFAAGLAVPWLLVTAELFARGLMLAAMAFACRRDKTTSPSAAICRAAALLFPIVAGVAATLWRSGVPVGEFPDQIVLLTGVHFHYAGFALPLLAGGSASRRPGKLAAVMTAGIVFGTPLVGLGITYSPTLEWVGALLLCAACWLLAVRTFAESPSGGDPTTMMLRLVSAASLTGAMALAAVYATGEYTNRDWLDIPTMIPLHGAANAIGFSLCGLFAEARQRGADHRC